MVNNDVINDAVRTIIKELFNMDCDVVGVFASNITRSIRSMSPAWAFGNNNNIGMSPMSEELNMELKVIIDPKTPAQRITNNINNAWKQLKK